MADETTEYRDKYFEEKFGNLSKTLTRIDDNQDKLFGMVDELRVDVAELKEAKRERGQKNSLWGAVSGGTVAALLFIAKWFMEE